MRDRELDNLYIGLMYESLWEKTMCWLYSIDRERDIADSSLRGRMADFCDRRDAAWRARWVARRREPPARWKRHAK